MPNSLCVYDIETNGLLFELDKVHIITMHFLDGDPPAYYTDDDPQYPPLHEGIEVLNNAKLRIGHNIYNFDEYALKKVYGDKYNPKGALADTLLLSRLVFPNIYGDGPNTFKIPKFLRTAHTLKAWGYRLNEHKGEYNGAWETYNDDMMEYAKQDPLVTEKLYRYLMNPKRKPSARSIAIEHGFARVIARQEQRGFTFDMSSALDMQAEVCQRMADIEEKLVETYGSWWSYKTHSPDAVAGNKDDEYDNRDEDQEEEVDEEEAAKRLQPVLTYPAKDRQVAMKGFPDVTIRRFSKKTGKELKPYVGPPKCNYTANAPYVKIERVTFNPGSRTHIQRVLFAKHNWKPTRFTKKTEKGGGGSPIVDDAELQRLADKIPEAQLLADYFLLSKRRGQLSKGPSAWIKCAREDGDDYRIYGRVVTNGAVTGRCTHSKPNVAQVPSAKKEWTDDKSDTDKEKLRALKGLRTCRSLFIPRPKHILIGNDGAGLELCMLAHYLAPHDGGSYARVCADPDMDNHVYTRDAIGTDIMGEGKPGRDKAKTTIYAEIYGGGLPKLGSIIEPDASLSRRKELGAIVKNALADRFTGFGDVVSDTKDHASEFGYLLGLDGRKLPVRKAHAALNTLLQSAGAVTMKQALIILDEDLRKAGLVAGNHFEFVGNIHDEIQAELLLDSEAMIRFLDMRREVDRIENLWNEAKGTDKEDEVKVSNPKLSLDQKIDLVGFEPFTIYMTAASSCVRKAGEALGLRCELRGDAMEGLSWEETH